MKAASPALVALLASGRFVRADIWTITLAGGQVIRWSGADIPITANGNTFALGPALDPGSVSEKIGVAAAIQTLSISAGPRDQINGQGVIPFIIGRGLDGALVKRERAYMADWASPVVGTVVRFSGRVTSIDEIEGSTAQVTISSWMILLNVNMPAHLYQTACLHQVYDTGCALNAANFSASGAVAAGKADTTTPANSTTPTQIAFLSSLSGTTGAYTGGTVTFTSGANAGVIRKAQTLDGTGLFTLANPLPSVPAAGDAFTATKGCDRTSTTCSGVFNNLANFKATEFVPVPETAL